MKYRTGGWKKKLKTIESECKGTVWAFVRMCPSLSIAMEGYLWICSHTLPISKDWQTKYEGKLTGSNSGKLLGSCIWSEEGRYIPWLCSSPPPPPAMESSQMPLYFLPLRLLRVLQKTEMKEARYIGGGWRRWLHVKIRFGRREKVPPAWHVPNCSWVPRKYFWDLVVVFAWGRKECERGNRSSSLYSFLLLLPILPYAQVKRLAPLLYIYIH